MKTSLKIASVLTWFNLVLWGGFIAYYLLLSIALGAFPLVGLFVVLSAIPLNCYAALQLQKSVRNPAIKLSSQVPTGIRFVGLAALFFGMLFILCGTAILQNTGMFMDMFRKQMEDYKDAKMTIPSIGYVKRTAIGILFLGLCIVVNVVLNFRLLRWYYLVRQSDVS
jgi:hypothetical protein